MIRIASASYPPITDIRSTTPRMQDDRFKMGAPSVSKIRAYIPPSTFSLSHPPPPPPPHPASSRSPTFLCSTTRSFLSQPPPHLPLFLRDSAPPPPAPQPGKRKRWCVCAKECLLDGIFLNPKKPHQRSDPDFLSPHPPKKIIYIFKGRWGEREGGKEKMRKTKTPQI